MPHILEITTTIDRLETAQAIGRKLLEQKLVACFQIDGPIRSLYVWNDERCEADEYRCKAKSTVACEAVLLAAIEALHPYELPEIAIQHSHVTAAYAQWVSEQIAAPT